MSIRKEAAKTAIVWSALLILMLLTRPAAMPVYFLSVPFVILGFGTYNLWKLLVMVYTRSSKDQAVLTRRQRAAGIAVSLLVVVVAGLQSIGEMSIRDIVTVTLLAFGLYFYFVRNLIHE